MKDNTYVIPAVDFYIIKTPEEMEKDSNLSQADARYRFNRLIEKEKKLDMVPLDAVDGLTVSEMASTLNIEKYFLIAAVSNFDGEIKSPDRREIAHYTTVFDNVMITINEEIANIEVDKVYENYIKDVYFCSTDNQKRYYCSFLEQYRYQDYEMTKQKVKEMSVFDR